MQNLHTGPFDIYAPLPFTFCIRANDVGNGVVPFPAFALTALGLVLDLACTNGDKVRLVNQFFHWRNIVKVVVAGNSVQQGGSQGGVGVFLYRCHGHNDQSIVLRQGQGLGTANVQFIQVEPGFLGGNVAFREMAVCELKGNVRILNAGGLLQSSHIPQKWQLCHTVYG